MAGIDAPEDFRRQFHGVAGQLASGVAVVSTIVDDEPHAATASSVVPASYDPPLVAVFFASHSRTHDRLRHSGRFSISLLGAADHDLARRFALPKRKNGWKAFVGVDVIRREEAPPLLANAIAWIDCKVSQIVPVGDHSCFVGLVTAMERRPTAEPLVYYRGRFFQLGPAVAPGQWFIPDADDLTTIW